MIKLVLAGSRAHYDAFLQKLWEKDKPVGDYHYITTFFDLRGFSGDCRIVKLGNFREHPEKPQILEEAQSRFDMNTRRSRVRLNEAPTYVGQDSIPTLTTAYDGPMPSTTSPAQIRYYGPDEPLGYPAPQMIITDEVGYGQDEAASSEAPTISQEERIRGATTRIEALEHMAQEREGLQQATREDRGYQRMNVGYGALPTLQRGRHG